MKIHKAADMNSLILKYVVIVIMAVCGFFSDFIIQQINMTFFLSVSSIFIFLIIGLSTSSASLVIVTLLNCALIAVNGFNLFTVIQTIEIYYVWVLYKSGRKNIILEVVVYGLCFSLPLIFVTGYNNASISVESAFYIALFFMNRVFNALISKMVLDYIPMERIISYTHSRPKAVTLTNLVTQVSIASIVVPILLFSIATNASNQEQISESAVTDLKSASEYINKKLTAWTVQEMRDLKLLKPIQVYDLIDMVQIYVSRADNSVNFYLLDLDNKIITSEHTADFMKDGLNWIGDGSFSEVEPDIYKWTAPRDSRFIIKDYTRDTAFFYVTSIDKFKTIIAVSGTAYDDKSINFYMSLLKLIVPISLFVGVFFIIMKRFMLNSIFELISITSGLPQKLKNNENIEFEKSNIYEIDSLTTNFRMMVDNLSSMIQNVEAANKKLLESERLLYDQAHFDSLTGLPNRPYFIKKVENDISNFYTDERFAGKQGIAFFFIDLDKFKAVNDTYGHSAGDKLLKQVANIMNSVLMDYESTSSLVARMGGDEFVIEYIYDNKEDIAGLANSLIAAINKPKQIDSIVLTPGTSIGICVFPEDGEDIDSIFLKSDSSMYKAKNSGGNKFYFYSKL
ncbi:diguanylate cyclase (GGDEF)-like protein [Ruminiclostridium sufflavum DSM 19573]|uniref:Diguanylate cyclase (GGDEF)-like protein n=1 Tax=Ruminiclostridium sufflavum DSM 19573 TaxID=1121337 RepID=A0A318XII2_9FIRM|nr:GGDEF domain-containing protein [Ruminiclostridium sufflavum]PYG86995.1 diguanylate cyclase (GGDEF)-like protein [Ruminiclostridium sufflavum DSM 19573]